MGRGSQGDLAATSQPRSAKVLDGEPLMIPLCGGHTAPQAGRGKHDDDAPRPGPAPSMVGRVTGHGLGASQPREKDQIDPSTDCIKGVME